MEQHPHTQHTHTQKNHHSNPILHGLVPNKQGSVRPGPLQQSDSRNGAFQTFSFEQNTAGSRQQEFEELPAVGAPNLEADSRPVDRQRGGGFLGQAETSSRLLPVGKIHPGPGVFHADGSHDNILGLSDQGLAGADAGTDAADGGIFGGICRQWGGDGSGQGRSGNSGR